MKPLLFTLAALRWLCYTTRRSSSHFYTNPSRYTIYWHFRPRWWLPFFWLLWLLGLPIYLFDGGLMDWWHELTRCFNPQKRVNYTRQGHGDLPTRWADRVRWWYQAYAR